MILELQEKLNNLYAFILGREQKIALAEIESVLRRFGVCFDILSVLENIALFKLDFATAYDLSPVTLFTQLGGSVKLFQIVRDLGPDTKNIQLESLMTKELAKNNSSGTLNFALSDYSNSFSAKQLSEMGIKTKIQARKKRPVRFVAGKDTEMSSATSYHKIFKTGGEEFGIFKNSKVKTQNQKFDDDQSLHTTGYLLGRLIATSNPDEWSDRDYGKPAGDKYSGMMPPKLARMMVNIALGQVNPKIQDTRNKQISNSKLQMSNKMSNDQSSKDSTLDIRNSELPALLVMDPFCGSGNILMEAKMLGCEVAGSDISEKAVSDTRANLGWLISNHKFLNPKQAPSTKSQPFCHSRLDPESLNRPASSDGVNSRGSTEGSKKNNNLTTASGGVPQNAVTIQPMGDNDSVFKADATSADFISELKNRKTEKQKNIVVVTEPYLGTPKKVKSQKLKAKSEVEELKALYIAFFDNIKLLATCYSLLTIVFVFPLIETTDSGTISLYAECIDDLHQMGYNTSCTLEYGRDYQVVKRQIAVLTKEPKN